MRTATRTLIAAAVVAGLVAACGPGETDEDGEIVWALPAAFRELEATADAWNEQNPDRPVRIEWLPEGADDQRSQLTLELNAESTLFDVLGIDVIWTGEFGEEGWLEPLDEHRDDVEGVQLAGPVESAIWDGQLWAVPYISGAAMLYYRSDLVDEPPRTWEELRDVAMEVAEAEGIAPYVAQGARYEGMVVNYLEYLWSAGGELLDPETGAVLFAEGDAAQRALEFMRDGFADGLYAPGYNTMMEEDARAEFQAGNAVFMRNWVYAHGLLSVADDSEVADRFDVAPLPTFDGDGTISAVGGVNNAVSAFSTRTEDAIEFALFAGTDEAVQRQVGEEFRHAPARADIYDQLEGDPVFEVLGEVMPNSRARPPVPEWNEISSTLQLEVYPAYNGQQEVEATVESIQSQLEDLIGS